MMKLFAVFMAIASLRVNAATDRPVNEKIWSTRDARWLTLAEWRAKSVQAGDVVVLGEQHAVGDTPSERVHHANQLRLLEEISLTLPVSLGMEFFDYQKQNVIDQYVAGTIAEEEFLRLSGWGGNSFPLYRDQVLFPPAHGAKTWGLNIPRTVSSKVSRGVALTPEEEGLLPPLWERGGAEYFERFSETMRGHVSDQKIEAYFMAQSLWDDTMAWKISEAHPAGVPGVFVVIVGEFHVEFGQGLPARLTRHGVGQVKTMVQVEVETWSEDALQEAIASDAKYGSRADFIWVYSL
jgi:uncharacterized iron-regulated protein